MTMSTHEITSRIDNDRPALTRRKVTTQAASKTPSTPQNDSSPPRQGQGLQITIESINFQLRKITKNRGHFPDKDAAMKLLYLGLRNISSQRGGESGTGTQGWKIALNTMSRLFPGRLPLC